MAQNDMYVIMYKTIAYIYSCMKKGEEPEEGAFSAESLGIPYSYWSFIMSELVSHGFLNGVSIALDMGGNIFVNVTRPRVTMEGIAFAQENSMMGKAKAFLKEAKASIPFV